MKWNLDVYKIERVFQTRKTLFFLIRGGIEAIAKHFVSGVDRKDYEELRDYILRNEVKNNAGEIRVVKIRSDHEYISLVLKPMLVDQWHYLFGVHAHIHEDVLVGSVYKLRDLMDMGIYSLDELWALYKVLVGRGEGPIPGWVRGLI